ncbi:unnamed protein product [Adineta steineri]|uniref:Secreted protein n=1 Tax=Adineta steineri TaxID=433720 RepID=A0A814YYC1_9BILA|nr:unnamed protein product [Adineta steineri]
MHRGLLKILILFKQQLQLVQAQVHQQAPRQPVQVHRQAVLQPVQVHRQAVLQPVQVHQQAVLQVVQARVHQQQWGNEVITPWYNMWSEC